MKILFLDDSEERINVVKKRWGSHELSIARTAKEAITLLQNFKFDLVSLDHDLGGEVYQKSGNSTGYEVAQFIAKMKQPPPIVIVHSWNHNGAMNMMQEFEGITETDYQPFQL